MNKISKAVQLITFQFSFSKIKNVPQWMINNYRQQKSQEVEKTTYKAPGAILVEPAENTSLEDAVTGIFLSEFHLVNAYYAPRNDSGGKYSTTHVVKFIFGRTPLAETGRELLLFLQAQSALHNFCNKAFWQVTVYDNPWHEEGVVVEGKSMLSFNMNMRISTLTNTGAPVTQWLKDSGGARLGNAPVPIVPAHVVKITDGIPQLA